MVIEFKITEWVAGVSLMPNGDVFPSGVDSFTNPDWIGFTLFDFTTFAASVPKSQYEFDTNTGTLTRLAEGAIFEHGVNYRASFAPRLADGGNVTAKKPVDIRFGVTPIPSNESLILPAGISTFVVPAWVGFEIKPYRKGSGFMVETEEYSWDKDTATFTLLTEGDAFQYNELLTVFFIGQAGNDNGGSGSGDDNSDDCSDWNQYPHTMRWTRRNQVTLASQPYERRCRLEQGGSTITGLNTQGNNIKAIAYMSSPQEDAIEVGQQVEIYNQQELLMADTVKNFVKGFFNVRVWL